MPLGATLSEFAEWNPSEIPSRTQSVSAFLFGKFSKGPHSFGKTLRDLTHPLMGSTRTLCSLDTRSQGATPSPSKGVEKMRIFGGSARMTAWNQTPRYSPNTTSSTPLFA
jgi:hypothetical protein